MMKIFVSNNVVLFILVVTTTIDASRIFYLPLPKVHSPHQENPKPNIIEETKKKPISDEFIPASALEQEEIEKRGEDFDWETLINEEAAKRRTFVDKFSSEHRKHQDENKRYDNNDDSEIEASIDKLSQYKHEQNFEKPWVVNSALERVARLQTNAELNSIGRKQQRNDTLFIVVVGICCAVGVVGLVAAAIFWYKIQKRAESAADAEYPAYGVTGPNTSGGKISPSSTMSDRKLAHSAQMFHYQQQRQQMMAQEKAHLDAKPVHSDDSDDEAPGGGDYTVYECPGLAPTGEMEVRNPLFAEPDSSLLSSGSNSNSTTINNFPQLSTSPPKEKSLP
jgi:hypothetical protein